MESDSDSDVVEVTGKATAPSISAAALMDVITSSMDVILPAITSSINRGQDHVHRV